MVKILSENWFSNWTYQDRYYLTGIEKHILDYLNETEENKIIIIDVGCSTATALKQTQTNLKKKGISVFTIGIDSDRKVSGMAEKNIDRFINLDVTKIEEEFNADIVICSKMALWVSAERRHQIITKCVSFLKRTGKLITDIDDYGKTGILEDLVDMFRYDLPPFWILKDGFSKFQAEYRYRLHGRFRKRMKSFDKEEAERYAEHILNKWKNFRWDQKLLIKLEILMLNIIYRIFPKNPVGM